MMFDTKQLVQFKSALHQAKESRRDAWEASSKLVGGSAIGTTLPRLVKAIDESDQPDALKDALRKSLSGSSMTSLRQIQGEPLKQLTGLPTTKAVRALCVLFLTESTRSSTPCSRWSPLEVENFLRAHCNPYDLLLDIDIASLLDIGAGDLSFAAELADQYVPLLRARHRQLVLHGIDRLRPGSQLGGRLHADSDILKRLNGTDALTAEFWGNQDMFALDRRKDVWPVLYDRDVSWSRDSDVRVRAHANFCAAHSRRLDEDERGLSAGTHGGGRRIGGTTRRPVITFSSLEIRRHRPARLAQSRGSTREMLPPDVGGYASLLGNSFAIVRGSECTPRRMSFLLPRRCLKCSAARILRVECLANRRINGAVRPRPLTVLAGSFAERAGQKGTLPFSIRRRATWSCLRRHSCRADGTSIQGYGGRSAPLEPHART